MVYLLTWIPFVSALALLAVPSQNKSLLKTLTLAACGISFALTLYLFLSYDIAKGGFQFIQTIPWISQLGITYKVGLDGINLTLCLLHALVSITGAFMAVKTTERLKEYLFFYLILVGAIYGVFSTLDLFFLYLFYETTLIPLYPMIGIWGSKNKEYGAMKLTLFITSGAVLSLVGLMTLYYQADLKTFDLIALTQALAENPLSFTFQKWLAPIILIGFGVMASLWPIHSWSPIGYAAAPTSVSMLHAGVLKKMGPYFILRVAVGMLPQGTSHWGHALSILAGIGIIYAGYAAMKQKDMKFMIGFSSVSHMGYILLGIAAMTPVALSGAVLLMFSHGVMAACTFALIGFVYEQTHARSIHDYGALGKSLPFWSVCFIMACMASLGLPGFSNFASELLVLIGSWQKFPVVVCFAVFGILITALYLLRAVKHICYGEENKTWPELRDAVSWEEKLPFIVLLGALLLFGFWPNGLLRIITPSVVAMLP